MSTNTERLVKLADRMAVLMVVAWRHYGETGGDFRPFDEEIFWHSGDCDELRAMPEYQQALAAIREMM